jgi:hypothetical protein
MSNLINFEIKKHNAMKFIGKSVYFRAGHGCGDIWFHDVLQENCGWVFEKLDEMKEYASDIPNRALLLTWDKHCEKTHLLGFTSGRFMKPDAPVPDGMDYFDIAEGHMGVGVFDNWEDGTHDRKVADAIEQTGEYADASWRFMGELSYDNNEGYLPPGGIAGYFNSCDKK